MRMGVDPVQAANIIVGVWQMLHGSDEPDREPSAPVVVDHSAREERELEAMRERTDRLVLVAQAMWTLMTEKLGVTDADLVKRMTDLDASDGTVDGRVTAPPVRCSCGAMVCRKLGRCLFCGKPYGAAGTFDTL